MEFWSRIAGHTFLRRNLRCSFCRRSEHQVERLVAGAAGYICDQCVAACVGVLQEAERLPTSSIPH